MTRLKPFENCFRRDRSALVGHCGVYFAPQPLIKHSIPLIHQPERVIARLDLA
jgi:hypothetical protein